MKTSKEAEIRWLDLLVMAIGDNGERSIYEVTDSVFGLLPPHLIYRKKRDTVRDRHGRRMPVTIHGQKVTRMGKTIRYAVRKGYLVRSVPINKGFPRNVGNYSMRLTRKGVERMRRIRRYVCQVCLHQGITRPLKLKWATCGKCHSRKLKFY